jgi:hypothetical protein
MRLGINCLIENGFFDWPGLCHNEGVNKNHENRKRPADGTELSPIQNAILQYLKQHPESCDTALGIARWWLPQQGIEAGSERVREALADLVRRGQLVTIERTGGETQYAIARHDTDCSD